MELEEIEPLLTSLKRASLTDEGVANTLQKLASDTMATQEGVQHLLRLGCVQRMQKLLHQYVMNKDKSEEKKAASEKCVNEAVRILAKLLWRKKARQRIKTFGIQAIVHLLTHCSSKEVKVHCCLSLKNLALFGTGRLHPEMMKDHTVDSLLEVMAVKHVPMEELESDMGSDEFESNCIFPPGAVAVAACHAVMLLTDNFYTRQMLFRKSAVKILSDLIMSEHPRLLSSAMRSLAYLVSLVSEERRYTDTSCLEAPLVRWNILQRLLKLFESGNDTLSQQAFIILHCLAHFSNLAIERMSFYGGADLFLSYLDVAQTHISRKGILEILLCLLDIDENNQSIMLQCNGLKVLLEALVDDAFSDLHSRIITALGRLCSKQALTALLESGLFSSMLPHLQHCGNFTINFVDIVRSAVSLLHQATGLTLNTSAMEEEEETSGRSLGREVLGSIDETFSGKQKTQSHLKVVSNGVFTVSARSRSVASDSEPFASIDSLQFLYDDDIPFYMKEQIKTALMGKGLTLDKMSQLESDHKVESEIFSCLKKEDDCGDAIDAGMGLNRARTAVHGVGEEGAAVDQGPGGHQDNTFTTPCPPHSGPTPLSQRAVAQGCEKEHRFFVKRQQRWCCGLGRHGWTTHSQQQILHLMYHVTHYSDLSTHVASYQILQCLTDHLTLPDKPKGLCVLVLSQMMSDPHSLASLLEMGAPAVLVHSLLLDGELRLVAREVPVSATGGWSQRWVAGRRSVLHTVGSMLLKDLSLQALSASGHGVIQRTFHGRPPASQLLCAASLLFLYTPWEQQRWQKVALQQGAVDRVLTGLCTPRTSPDSTIIKDVLGLALISLSRDLRLSPQYPSPDMASFVKPALHSPCPGPSGGQESATASPHGNSGCVAEGQDCPYSRANKDLKIRVEAADSYCVLHANREMLVTHCDMFAAMLQGGFQEASQFEIDVHGVDAIGMTIVLHYLHGCDSRCSSLSFKSGDGWLSNEYPYQFHDDDDEGIMVEMMEHWLGQILDAFVVADYFRLPELVHYLCAIVRTSCMDPSFHAEPLLEFAASHGICELAEEAVIQLLCSSAPVDETTSRLTDLAEGQYGSTFRAAVVSVLKRALSLHEDSGSGTSTS
ncbi:hypothetical protein ACOMHN_031105 [Nucella lapillus]